MPSIGFIISFYSYNGGEGPSEDEYNWQRKDYRPILSEHSTYSENKNPSYGIVSPTWVKEQRNKMNRNFAPGLTLREFILERDNYTCQCCGNSIKKEPNLLLEVDHIKPVSKGGASIPGNLQTLCWKCNRSKSNKI